MALHPSSPESPYAILDAAIRWFPEDEALRESSAEKLMPPLLPRLRREVQSRRDAPPRMPHSASSTMTSMPRNCIASMKLASTSSCFSTGSTT